MERTPLKAFSEPVLASDSLLFFFPTDSTMIDCFHSLQSTKARTAHRSDQACGCVLVCCWGGLLPDITPIIHLWCYIMSKTLHLGPCNFLQRLTPDTDMGTGSLRSGLKQGLDSLAFCFITVLEYLAILPRLHREGSRRPLDSVQ